MSTRDDITATVRLAQDTALATRDDDRASVSARVLALRAARLSAQQRRTRMGWTGAVATLALAASAILLVRWPRSSGIQPLSFTVEGQRGNAGSVVLASAAPVGVAFSDGSALDLAPGSSMRVAMVDHVGAEIVLEHGSVATHVVPRSGNRWSIAAGPYRVLVTGTRFDTTWEPGTETLRVAMKEGHVLVTGGCLEGARSLGAGDSTEVACARKSVAPEIAPPPPATSMPAPSSVAPPKPRASAPLAPLAPSSDDLMSTADHARRSGQLDVAEHAYREVRARFPATSNAASATFLLARMLADAQRSAEAETLFVEYTRSPASATFAEEAWGRLLELARARGDHELARSRARIYVERFPHGAASDVARAVLAP
jgi:hypothetical protein